jgi:hypothetical protein
MICTLCLSLATSFALAEDSKESDKPKTPPAKAIGTGVWADGFEHVVQGTSVGRGCLKVRGFQVAGGKALYTCLTIEDKQFHVVYDTRMDETGYHSIEDLEVTEDGKLTYVGHKGRQHCTVNDGKGELHRSQV